MKSMAPNRRDADPQASSQAMAQRRGAESQQNLFQRDSNRLCQERNHTALHLLLPLPLHLTNSPLQRLFEGIVVSPVLDPIFPSVCSLLCSLGMLWPVRYKSDVESHLERLLEREKEDGNLLAKCVEELKKKGIVFDLLKEVDALKRAKSLRVEAKIVKKWSARDFVTMFFFTLSCLVLALTRVTLCS